MNQLNIDFENCYGIKKLYYTFDFRDKSTYAIYAPNGSMKTSFAKTFMDLSEEKQSEDLIFRERETKRIIRDENNSDLEPDNIFVIVPYNQAFRSKRISTLLVNRNLKEEYDKIHQGIDSKKDILTKELIAMSGLKKDLEETLSEDFTSYRNDFFRAMGRVRAEVEEGTDPEFSDITYSNIFHPKVIAFLETKNFKEKLTEYIEKYNDLIDTSTYFQKGIFNHNNASTIAKNLKDNGFFKAKHSVSLNAKDSKKEITTEEELTKLIQEEKEAILENPDLSKAFEEIDKALTKNKDLKSFRAYLIRNPKILPELSNINGFKQKLWISYLKTHKELFHHLTEEYNNGKENIEIIVNQAKQEETNWRDVIDIFNNRFSVPFKLKVQNQEDVILKEKGPSIKFEFIDNQDKCEIEENQLYTVLSNGEKRALYILNIIFEVQVRIKEKQLTTFIVDDIADSFDYKNKYAIIEYLQDISNNDLFTQIILTHNYDFFRTISSRLDMKRKQKLNTIKSEDKVILQEELYQNNPFTYWKKHLNNSEMMIASIPFVRNIAEFIDDQSNFDKLTSLLHIKSDTRTIRINQLEAIFKEILNNSEELVLENREHLVLDLVYQNAGEISKNDNEAVELEKKIVLSIGIRLKAEEYLISAINDDDFVNGITKNQTYSLTEKYKALFPDNTVEIDLINQVNLMTPENIHINSFMYEPILDMANIHLKELYQKIEAL